MANNTPQNEITEQNEMNGVVTSMNYKLGLFLNLSLANCSIYQVPEFILKGREYFYQPKVLSIGPAYYQDPKLATMQKVKWIYLNCFLQHPNNACQSVEPYIDFVREKEVEIRGSYQEQSRLSSDEFVEMIVLDAAFLIYHFMCIGNATLPFEIPFPNADNKLKAPLSYSKSDLFLLENQIPYFVLKGIFRIAFGHICSPITLIDATLIFIGIWGDGIPGIKAIESIFHGNKITNESAIAHLLHLQWMCCWLSIRPQLLHNLPNRNPIADLDSYIHCRFGCVEVSLCNRQRQHLFITYSHGSGHLSYTAKQLKDAGVTFVAGESDNPLDVTFSNGKLTISKLIIYDATESHLRNLVYFEHCHYYGGYSYFIDYILFLDELIDTVEDVQVLVKNKILSNHLGSDDDIVKLFNNIAKNVRVSSHNYMEVNDALNRYASTRRHRWMAIFRSKYFN